MLGQGGYRGDRGSPAFREVSAYGTAPGNQGTSQRETSLPRGKHHLPDREETGNAAGTLVFSLDELARTVLSSSYLGGDRYLIFTAKKDGFGPCKLTPCLLFGLWSFSFFPILAFLPLLYYF